MQATAPPEERHDVTLLYHRMDLQQVQDRFSLKVRPDPLSEANWSPGPPLPAGATLPAPEWRKGGGQDSWSMRRLVWEGAR